MDEKIVLRDLANKAARAAYEATCVPGAVPQPEADREAWLTATRDRILAEWSKSTETVRIVFTPNEESIKELRELMRKEISEQLDERIDDKFDGVKRDIEEKCEDIEKRMDKMDEQFTALGDVDVADLESTIKDLEEKVDDLDTKVDDYDADKERLEERIDDLEKNVQSLEKCEEDEYSKKEVDSKVEEIAKATSDRHMIRHKMEYHGYTDQGAAMALAASTFLAPETGATSPTPQQ